MREASFASRRRDNWARLEALVSAVERHGVANLAENEVTELARLYRSATSDLAIAQGRGYGRDLIDRLNRSVGRAHAVVYLGEAPGGWERIRHFFEQTLPSELRRSSGFIAVCALLMLLPAVFAFAEVLKDAHAIYALLPEGAIPAPIRKSLHDSNFAVSGAFAPALSAEVITNNIRVAMGAFAGGMTAGLLTIYLLIFNGFYLGALAALFTRAGFGLDFWATVAPHGSVELPSIAVAAAAGLIIAKGLVLPGRLRRIDALTAAARRAGILLVGVVALLIWAGIFEGFVSPRRISPELRLAIGALNGTLLACYWILMGRRTTAGRST